MNDQVDELVNAGLNRMKSTEWMRQVEDAKNALREEAEPEEVEIDPLASQKIDIPVNRYQRPNANSSLRVANEPVKIDKETANLANGLINAFDQLYQEGWKQDKDMGAYESSKVREDALKNMANYYERVRPNDFLRDIVLDMLYTEQALRTSLDYQRQTGKRGPVNWYGLQGRYLANREKMLDAAYRAKNNYIDYYNA